jgi:hypothetical protein
MYCLRSGGVVIENNYFGSVGKCCADGHDVYEACGTLIA